MSSGLVYLRPVRLVYTRAIGPYAQSMQVAWSRLYQWMDEAGLSGRVTLGYGMARDDPRKVAAEARRYDACIELTPEIEQIMPADFRVQTLPGGTYLRYRHIGTPNTIRGAIAAICKSGDSRGLMGDSSRPLIEIYLADPRFTPAEKLRSDICLPVKAQMSADANAA